jgi:hypothetical protein
MNVAVPCELSQRGREEVGRKMAEALAVHYNVGVDYALHQSKQEKNIHYHFTLSACSIEEDGSLGKKVNELDPIHCKRNHLETSAEVIRPAWSNIVNAELEREKINERIDHRSYKELGIDRLKTIHVGYGLNKESREAYNIEVRAKNKQREKKIEKPKEIKPIETKVEKVPLEVAIKNDIESIMSKLAHGQITTDQARTWMVDKKRELIGLLQPEIKKQYEAHAKKLAVEYHGLEKELNAYREKIKEIQKTEPWRYPTNVDEHDRPGKAPSIDLGGRYAKKVQAWDDYFERQRVMSPVKQSMENLKHQYSSVLDEKNQRTEAERRAGVYLDKSGFDQLRQYVKQLEREREPRDRERGGYER